MGSKLRVCFVSSYPPNHARLSEYAQHLVKEIANRPAVGKVFVLADKAYGSKTSLDNDPKVEVLRVWQADKPFSILRIMLYILRLKPDVVQFNLHFQSFGRSRGSNFCGFLLVHLCRVLGFRVIVLLHNLAEKVDLKRLRIKSSFLNRVGMNVAMRFVLSASVLVVPLRSYADYLMKRYSNVNVHYVAHGTSSSVGASVAHSGKVVLMFGHMGPSKGVPVIFQAFEELSKCQDGIRLVIAGGSHPNYPSYLSDLRKVAPRGVDFIGYVEEQDVERVFGMADVVVLPYYLATGTSGVFHMACGYGKPVVASDLPEIREQVAEGASALLIPAGDVAGFKSALLSVLFNRDVAEKMSWQNRVFAKGEDWSAVAEAYEKIYFAVVGSKS